MRLYAIAVACVLIAGCERKPAPNQTAAIVVTDDANHAVRLAKPATRIVSLLPTITDLIVAMHQQRRMIARTDYDTDTSLARLPSVGGGLTPSLEWLAAEKPDLVISWPDRGSRSIDSQMTTLGIPVYSVAADTIANTYAAIRNLGILLGVPGTADSLLNSMRAQLDSVRSAVSGKRRVRVAYVVSVTPTTVVGPHTFIDEIIAIAGGENVFSDIANKYADVSLEELVRRDPDVVIAAREQPFDARVQLAKLAGWRDLRAVRAGHVYAVSANDFNRSGPNMPRAAQLLSTYFAAAR